MFISQQDSEEDPACAGDDPEEWNRFKFFMDLECCIFATNLLSAILFMFLRAFFHNQMMWDIEEQDKWEETDAIVENLEQIDILQ